MGQPGTGRDAGIRGPDFIWAATGPALEAYSKHPAVKKADEPNQLMTVPEFLREVRRIVVDYVVGRVLSRNGDGLAAEGLDDLTIYYLLHRHDLLAYGKARAAAEIEGDEDKEREDAEDEENEETATSGSTLKLKRWDQRRRKDLGLNAGGQLPGGAGAAP